MTEQRVEDINVNTKGKLSDEELNTVVNSLANNIGPETKKMREIINDDGDGKIPYNVMDRSNVIKSEASVEYNPNNGMVQIINDNEESEAGCNLDGLNKTTEELNKDVIINDENLQIAKDFNMNDEDALSLMNLIIDYQKDKSINVYSRLPEQAKRMVNMAAGHTTNISVINKTAKELLEYFISNMKINEAHIDLQKSIQRELEMPGIMEAFSEHQTEIMDKNLLEHAEKLKETNPDKAKTILALRESYIDAINLTTLKKEVDERGKNVKRLDKEVKKYNKHCRDFNHKYEVKECKFNIKSVLLVAKTLDRTINEKYKGDDILKFVILFIKITKNYSPDNILEHAYMYYTINTLLSLDYLTPGSDIYNKLISNIEYIIDKIKEIEKDERK